MFHCEISIHFNVAEVTNSDMYSLQVQQESQTVLFMVCIIARSAYSSDVAGVTNSVIYGVYHC